VLFIEATAYSGKGRLTVTGQLGEVMQESAQAAHSWVRSHAATLGLEPEWFADHDVHLHVPAGAVPKDGPSAGITMATAIASLVKNQTVSSDVGMTGEITLTGQVLPIGGVREKALAAQRAGLKRVILPRENEPDLEDLPDEARKELDFVLVDSIEEVLDVALDGKKPRNYARRKELNRLEHAASARDPGA
jgi:ATP-dependent Lon protease